MWLSVTLHTDAAHAEAFCDALLSGGALSVAVEDADAGTEREQPQFGEPGAADPIPWATSRIVALFDPSVALGDLICAAAAEAKITPVPPWSVDEVAEQNWVQLTQAQFDPIQIDPRLWIVPSWHDAPDPSAINIALDPGMAFGTGSHPTTALCLHWLSSNLSGGERVLDYGTGSGILAIAAARLGAGRVVGVDVDPAAITAAEENARQNRVAIELRHVSQPMGDRFDVVVANILTNPLKVLAPLLCARLDSGGRVILAGILSSQAAEIQEAYRPYLELEVLAEREGWVLLAGSK
jgi:ribosomal protein L11 methyltransferase